MNKILLVTALIFSISLTFAQETAEEGVKYAKTITATELKEHLQIIASDEYEGRETGKRGQKMAMRYLIKNFKEYNIEPLPKYEYVQSFPLIEQRNENITLIIKDKKYNLFQNFYLFNTYLPNKEIKSNLIFVGFGLSDDQFNNYKDIDPKGKVVMLIKKLPKEIKKDDEQWDLKKRIEFARKSGAEAVIVIDENYTNNLISKEHLIQKDRMFLKNHDLEQNIPTIYISAETAEEIFEKFNYEKYISNKKNKQLAPVSLTLKIDKPTESIVSENVLAYIPGADLKEEVVILTAHYDHIGTKDSLIFNGADDDGTGTVALLEIAEAFMIAKAEGNGPRRSILIMPVSGEEKGLLGSRYYSENPIFPLKNTVVNLNIDMIGRVDKAHEDKVDYIYLIGSDRLSQDLHDVSERIAKKYTDLELDYTFNDENDPNRFYYRSDHYNFAKNNIPVIFYFSGVHEDYHQSTDTVDKILFDKVEKVSRLIFFTAWEIANRGERIQLKEQAN